VTGTRKPVSRPHHPPGNPRAHLGTTTGTPDLSGSNTHWLHTCRMNPAFHADAASCIGGSARYAATKSGLRLHLTDEL